LVLREVTKAIRKLPTLIEGSVLEWTTRSDKGQIISIFVKTR
jgi:hypothetical protein